MKRDEYSPRANRYPNGYQPKIDYYQAKIANACDRLEVANIIFFAGKLEYFLKKQAEQTARLEKLY